MTTKAEGVRQSGVNLSSAGYIRHIIQITFRVRVGQVYCWRNEPVLDSHNTYRCLNRASTTDKVPHHRFGGAYRDAIGIVAKYGLLHLSSGDILRRQRAAGTELGKKAQSYMDSGALVPDEITVEMMADAISKARSHIIEEEKKYGKKVIDTVKLEIKVMLDSKIKRYGKIIGVELSEMSRVLSVLLNSIAKGFKENKK